MFDVSNEVKVLDHGYIRLIDWMGNDQSIEAAARQSYTDEAETRTVEQRTRLINYLMRHEHMTPFEMGQLVFQIKTPIFVARQWMRHRAGSFNEISGRYVELDDDYYYLSPEEWRSQSKSNKQGSESLMIYDCNYYDCEDLSKLGKTAEEVAFDEYDRRLFYGVARELARTCLPLSTYTTFTWSVNLRNLFHFLHLRTHPHAQLEIREYADRIEKTVSNLFPICYAAWVKHVKDAITLSSDDVATLRDQGILDSDGNLVKVSE